MKIKFGSLFLLRDLETNEEQCFRLSSSWREPLILNDNIRLNGSYSKVSRNVNPLLHDEVVTLICKNTPFGIAVDGKETGNIVEEVMFYEEEKKKYLILAVEEDEIVNYLSNKPKNSSTNTISDENGKVKTSLNQLKFCASAWYIKSQRFGLLAIVKMPHWKEDQCFVIEKFSIIEDKLYAVGKTFQNGRVYCDKAKFLDKNIFVAYTGQYKQTILRQYVTDYNSMRIDPIENNPDYKDILETVDALVKPAPIPGICYSFWANKQRFLKELFGVDWQSPSDLNPSAIWD